MKGIGMPHGITKLLLKSGVASKSRAILKGKGVNLSDPALPLSGSVTAQMHNQDTGLCLESVFSGGQIFKNDPVKGLFKAKTP